jgi:NADPH:quinone reductase-like Zn-dependent oxidoreductase
MKARVCQEFCVGSGSTDVLQLRDIDKPVVTDDELLVRVRAASVARGIWHFMTGLPYPMRFVGGLRAPKTPVPGMDMAGVVEAVGNKVTRFQPGDEVFGIGLVGRAGSSRLRRSSA